jgi:ketosteroid isomerase-like protein
MSEENVEIVRQGYEAANAFQRGELSSEALAELLDPQIEFHWHAGRTMPDEPQHLLGAPEVIGFWEQMRSAWVDLVAEPLELIGAPDDRVLVSVRQSGRGRESGVPIEAHAFVVWTIRDGRVRKDGALPPSRRRPRSRRAAGVGHSPRA